MPEITTIDLSMELVADIIDPPQPRDESKPHISDLISYARNPSETPEEKEAQLQGARESGIMALGRIWEFASRRWIEDRAKALGFRFIPHPLGTADGVVGSLDGLFLPKNEAPVSWDGQPPTVVEVKLRFAKPSDPANNWRWMSQIKSYCHTYRTQAAYLLAMHVTSNPPHVWCQEHYLIFSQKEIDSNWAMILSAKESRG